MSSAIVIGASGGIGGAVADTLDDEDQFDHVIRLSRSGSGEAHIDIEDEASIAAAAARIDGEPSLVFVATGLLHDGERQPEKSIAELDPRWLARNFAVNTIGPALVAKHFLPLMPRSERCVFAALSARVGSISDDRIGGWYGYRASKAALNMMIRNLAIEQKRKNDRSIIVALHPGTVDTPLSEPFQRNVPAKQLFDRERAALQLLDVIDGLKPADSGRIFAWDGEEIAP
ncbi:SDR family NAD(P)-dependent oxidoreductase [uncultured Parasphingopyxis sp.]|uniref:SDR family NAD(P)-dependent oxidoreductase n=1 Tax=uncultured Parasphingopyxis sp. TaxID=1547918 RepID=UPI002630103C|nr:SDR family NAD(P)-dependent oxidoreductase [uncultured Parasphingopyxis sp.]